MYSVIQKFGISKNFFFKSLMLIEAEFICSKIQKKTVKLWNIIKI